MSIGRFSSRATRRIRMFSEKPAQHTKETGAYSANEYQRRDEHKARTANSNEQSYILTLHTDTAHHKTMTELREKYFPPKINKISAHIAMFRALPGSEMDRIVDDLKQVTSGRQSFKVSANQPFRMKHGVGIGVDDGKNSVSIFSELKKRWEHFLSQQDMSFRPHYTVQNKVDDDGKVEQSLQEIKEQFPGSDGTVVGLSLYRYDRGHWRKEQDFPFE